MHAHPVLQLCGDFALLTAGDHDAVVKQVLECADRDVGDVAQSDEFRIGLDFPQFRDDARSRYQLECLWTGIL